MTNQTKAVEPCPFCGEAEMIEVPTDDRGYDPTGDLACFGCGAKGPIRDAAGQRADARERWNTRTPSPPADDVVEAVALVIQDRVEMRGLFIPASVCIDIARAALSPPLPRESRRHDQRP